MDMSRRPTRSVPSSRVRSSPRFRGVIAGAVALTAGLGLAVPAPVSAVAAASTARLGATSTGSHRVLAQLQAALDAVVSAGATGIEVHVDDGHHIYRLASGKARLGSSRALLPRAEV